MKHRKLIWISFGFLAFGLVLVVAIYLWSARIPERWQEISAGMKRDEVETFLGAPQTTTATDRDVWIIDRPIGTWELLVSYHNDSTFRFAHLNFKSAFPGKYDRARNYGWTDPPYHVRTGN
jgi:hypothetical protein